MKLFIYATDLEAVLRGDFVWSLKLSSRDDLGDTGDNWILLGEIEYHISLDREALTKKAVSNLGEQIQKVKAASHVTVTALETRQQNLLALTHG